MSEQTAPQNILQVAYAPKYKRIWSSDDTTCIHPISIYVPELPRDSSYKILGFYAQQTNKDVPIEGQCIVAKDKSGKFLAKPEDFKLIWKSDAMRFNTPQQISFWEPIPPKDFVALGSVFTNSWDKPSLDVIRCVHKDCVTQSKAAEGFLFNNEGSMSTTDFSLYIAQDVKKCITPNLIIALQQPNSVTTPNTTAPFFVLNKKFCKLCTWDTVVNHSTETSAMFKSLYNNKELADIIFNVQGNKIYANRIIAGFSDALQKLVSVPEKEIYIDESFEHFNSIIKYIYTGEIILNEQNVEEILSLADKYGLKELKDSCFDFIVKSIDKESVIDVMLKAKAGKFKFDATTLVEKCIKFLEKRAFEIIESDAFLSFDEEILILFCKNDNLCVDETDLFKAVMKWGDVQAQKTGKDKKTVLQNVIQHIRFPLMPVKDIIHVVRPTGLISDELYLQAIEYKSVPKTFEDSDSPQFRERFRTLSGTTILTISQCNQILKWIPGKRKSWILLYKGTRDSFSAFSFHAMCDNKGPTITIIKAKNGYIFGGYTPIDWNCSNTYASDNRSFLFSLVNAKGTPMKMTNTGRNKHSIYRCSSYGPTFGGGHDLYIANNSNTNTSSYSNLGLSYVVPGYTYGTTPAKTLLAGSYSFSVDEIEVFGLKERVNF